MDLPNRSHFEADFASKVEQLSARHKQEALRLLGSPPNPQNITQADWDRWEREDREKWLLLLLFVFDQSYAEHYRMVKGQPLDDEAQAAMTQAGQLWAGVRVDQLTSGYVRASREMLNAAGVEWQSQIQRGNQIDSSAVAERLEMIFGKSRAENIAVTETTAATSAGGEAAIVRTSGFSEEDTWFTEKDSKVCPICVPLHNSPRSLWASYFPEGPPAHPRCRCFLVYKSEKVGQLVGAGT